MHVQGQTTTAEVGQGVKQYVSVPVKDWKGRLNTM